MKKRILIPLVNGNEEIETITIFSILSRAGNLVNLIKCNDLPNDNTKALEITLSRGLRIKANTTLTSILSPLKTSFNTPIDCIVLPGGLTGASNYNKSKTLINILRHRKQTNKLYGAICATPSIFLAKHNLLFSKATCFPSFKSSLIEHGIQYHNTPFVIDNNIITGRSAGDALAFSLQLVRMLNGSDTYASIKKSVLL